MRPMKKKAIRFRRSHKRPVSFLLLAAAPLLVLSGCFSPLQTDDGGKLHFRVYREIGAQQWQYPGGTIDRALISIFHASDVNVIRPEDTPGKDLQSILIDGLPHYDTSVAADGIVQVPNVTPGTDYVLFVSLYVAGDDVPNAVGWSMDMEAWEAALGDMEFPLLPFSVAGGQTTTGITVGVVPIITLQ